MSVRPRAATTKNCLENRGALGVIFSHDDLPLERRTPYRVPSLHMVVGGAASFVTARDMFAKVLFREICRVRDREGEKLRKMLGFGVLVKRWLSYLSGWKKSVDRNSCFIFGPSLGFGFESEMERSESRRR